MITLESWVMIKHLHKEGVPKSRIAEELGLDRRTVDKAINEDKPPQQKRQSGNSILDPYKDYVKQRIDKYDLTATRVLREIKERGYPGSYTILKDYIKELKDAKPKPAFVRFETQPGEQAQVDWSDFWYVDLEGKRIKLHCFSMILGYSRMLYVEFFYSQNLVSLGQAHINAFRYFGGVTDTILYDNMKTIALSREGKNINWNPQFIDFASYYGFLPTLCRPRRKETKGKIERPYSYIQTSFFDGSEFNGLSDLNEKAMNWLNNISNTRIHGTTQAIPFERLKEENLKALRDGDYVLVHSEMRKSSKDCYISFEGNRYSIPYQYSCRDLSIKLTGEDLRIFYGEEQIASHKLSHQKGRMITDQKHFAGIPRPAYPTSVRVTSETFISHFPKANPFVDGLVKAKYGNARYHMQEILNLLEDYPQDVVESAIDRAMEYCAFDCGTVRNICRQKEPVEQNAVYHAEMSLSPRTPLISESVEERALSYYSELEE